MADIPTRTELFNEGANEIIVRTNERTTGNQITSDQIFNEGSDANLLLAGASAMAEAVARLNAKNISDLTLSGARGEDLDRLIADRFPPSVVRKQASPSRGELSFTRSSTAAGAVDYLAGSIVETTSGIRFELLQTVSFSASAVGPIVVEARAVEAGIGGNVAANTIVRPVTNLPDGTITFTNTTFFSGGSDVETDDSFVERAKRSYAAERRGTLAAIEYGALTVEGVDQATAEEPRDSNGQLLGFVYLYIADANGQANDQLIELVRVALLDYRSGGNPVDIFGSIPTYVSISLLLRYSTNINTQDAFNQVRDTVVARVNALQPGETLERALIIEACKSVSGVIVLDDAVVTPTGDVVPDTGEIIRTRTDLVTATT